MRCQSRGNETRDDARFYDGYGAQLQPSVPLAVR